MADDASQKFLAALHQGIQTVEQKNPGITPQAAQLMAMHPGSTMQGGNIILPPGQIGPGEQPAPKSDPGSVGWFESLLHGNLPFGLTFGKPAASQPPGPISEAVGYKPWETSAGGKDSGKTAAPAADPQSPDTARYLQALYDKQQYDQARPPQDALTMGLGMFFQKYLAPMMAQQNQANTGLISQYGQQAQSMLGDVPPEMRGILGAQIPQNQQTMQMLNQAGEQQAMGAIPYQQFIQQIGGQTAATQTLTDALNKLASGVATYGAQLGTFGPNLASMLPAGSEAQKIAQSLSGATGANPLAQLGATTGTTGGGTSITQAQFDALAPDAQAALRAAGITITG